MTRFLKLPLYVIGGILTAWGAYEIVSTSLFIIEIGGAQDIQDAFDNVEKRKPKQFYPPAFSEGLTHLAIGLLCLFAASQPSASISNQIKENFE